MTTLVEAAGEAEFLIAAAVIVGGALLAYYLLKVRPAGRAPSASGQPAPGASETAERPASAVPAVHRATPAETTGDTAPAPGPAPPEVTFSDVAGIDHAVDELREIGEYLADPERYRALGAEMPHGILLYGEPGCGKTLLARALAGEAGVPFFSASAASFVERYVGTGAARVRELFDGAKQHTPAIVFIDELDAVGRQRSDGVGGDREYDHTLNQLLVELDGFEGHSEVLLIGATNRPELIDSALLRPGRFDRRVHVEQPDPVGRERILRLHAAHRPFSRRVDWAEIASTTAGLSAAELANIVNESALLAARRSRERIAPEDVDEASDRVIAGTSSTRLLSPAERQRTAVHEAGHALLTLLVEGMRPPARVSIVGPTATFDRSVWDAGGDHAIRTRHDLLAQLIVLLGGRAAEQHVYGEPSTRAEDDLEHAAGLARKMVERWAMTGRFELAAERPGRDVPYAEGSAGAAEVRDLVAKAERAAKRIVADHETAFRQVATALATHETLTAAELHALVDESPQAPTALRRAAADQR